MAERPAGAPRRIPAWAWRLYAWWQRGRKGPRPDAPEHVPLWFWPWRLWRLAGAKARLRQITMYDSVDVSQIPRTAEAVAGYVGGAWPTFAALVKEFPHAHKLSIAVNASEDADSLDIENGDATPTEAPAWVKRQHARGLKRPGVYSSVAQMPAVLQALAKAGIPRNDVRVITAHYTGQKHRCTSRCGFGFTGKADATQWRNSTLDPLHRNLDTSVCAPNFFD